MWPRHWSIPSNNDWTDGRLFLPRSCILQRYESCTIWLLLSFTTADIMKPLIYTRYALIGERLCSSWCVVTMYILASALWATRQIKGGHITIPEMLEQTKVVLGDKHPKTQRTRDDFRLAERNLRNGDWLFVKSLLLKVVTVFYDCFADFFRL